ncbi:DUF3025 domain-containing protein [Alteromonas sp. C1M14]|uniref:DUF3025 domain-containing protein n=1 Tax=Alteromonas sp. C1M14 TaxID=2841567 RepID=UPI001C09C8F5|nr:DUF3025 domain-containing protein [Alteromonas sp. C1M14]MBU2977344.1 DUF3025 domain-containing protein [Alteromonas sp. C1M14]
MNSSSLNWISAKNSADIALPVSTLLSLSGLLKNTGFPTVEEINRTVATWHQGHYHGPIFKGQSTYDDSETRYYEQIVAEDGDVPTREGSWHDLFNALIWMQFPKTKAYLNALHVEDIQTFGLNPRTRRRNHITHFDECGVVLAIPRDRLKQGNALLTLLAQHQWVEGLHDEKTQWGDSIYPFVFGHAILEMMLNPFIGLTGKWLAVVVEPDFHTLSFAQQVQTLDESLVQRIQQLQDLTPKYLLKPLPVLGVPGWGQGQTLAFYQNQDYFRPKRANGGSTIQLPLT